MTSFRDFSINRKLQAIIMLTVGAALLLASAVFLAYDILAFRDYKQHDMSTLAEILGTNTAAALSFNDPKAAQEVLGALKARPHIVSAVVYTNMREFFAGYTRADSMGVSFPARAEPSGSHFRSDRLELFRDIFLGGQTIGTIYLRSDLDEINTRLGRFLGIMLVAMVASFSLALLLGARLQRVISEPILHLAQTANMVTSEKNFSLRAVKPAKDEVGVLIDRFNDMLSEIQRRDEALQRHSEHLEETVAARTVELGQTNQSLKAEVLERKRAELRMAAQHATAQALAESATLAEAVPRILQSVCEALGWEQGVVWDVDLATDRLQFVQAWHFPSLSFDEFEAASRQTRFPKGVGLPGRVWASGKPAWIPDVVQDANFPRAKIAAREGLHGAFGFPIHFAGETVGVIEFFSREIRQPDEDLLRMMATVGSQIGQFAERRKAEAALRQSEERTRLVVDTALDAAVSMDSAGVITGWNSQAEKILGWPRQEALNRRLSELIIPARYRAAHESGLQNFLLTGEGPFLNRRLEIEALHRDGHEFPVELSVAPIRLGAEWAFSAFISDITERRQVQEELRQAKEAAESANRAKSEFLANMSHEIRTPMNGILGMTELALDTELSSEQSEYLGMVKTSAESLLTLIDDILDFSKVEAGKLQLESIPFKLRAGLAEATRTLALRAHQKGLELAYRVDPEVPEDLLGDPTRLRQVVVNLLGNAVKFTERGEVVLHAGVDNRIDEGLSLHFFVADTGIGIPPEKQKSIFEAFTQADGSMTRKYGGTGLGLAISAQLSQLMGGRVWVESEQGKGSKFHFTARFGLPKGSVERVLPEHSVELRGMLVLIVDDNATNRRILEEIVVQWGMKPALAEGGWTALATLNRARDAGHPFSLVLADAQMPEMDGFTLASRIKQDPTLAGPTIMMLTSVGRPGDAARCRDAGIVAYLVKPIAQSDLLDAILMALGRAPKPAEQVALITRHSLRESRPSLRILLAEDNAVNRELAIRLLEKRGHRVEVATNGREALAALDKEAFDVVLMDLQMPEMDGLEATAAIRDKEKRTGRHIPIIAMTAHAMHEDRERCLATGMDAYISKPIKPKLLFEAIEGRLTGVLSPTAAPADGDHPPEKVLDRVAALAGVEGDADLLARMARTFVGECPRMTAKIQKALADGDAKLVCRAAHELKGCVGNFAARDAFEAVQRLEAIGREGDLTHAAEAWRDLEEALERLKPVLAGLITEVVQ